MPFSKSVDTPAKNVSNNDFALHHFNCDVSQTQHYDLVINSSQGTLPHHADLVAYAFLQRFGHQVRTQNERQKTTAMAR